VFVTGKPFQLDIIWWVFAHPEKWIPLTMDSPTKDVNESNMYIGCFLWQKMANDVVVSGDNIHTGGW